MKIQHLRIGNLVYFNGKQKEVGRVTGILESTTGENIISLNNRIDVSYLLNDIKPITITKDILLKLGFKKCDMGGYKIYTDVYESIDFNSILLCWVNEKKKPIKYVHDLQNLFFCLSRKELTANL